MGDQGMLPAVAYGFIGLGVMGYPMAQHLRAKIPSSSKMVICEIVEAQVKKFLSNTPVKGGIEVLPSPKAVAEQADIIITMLPAGPHVEDVFTNTATGLLSIPHDPARKPILFIECSTIPTSTSLSVSSAVTTSKLGHMVDAPVSGGPNGAYAATLTFMVGAPSNLFDTALPVLRAMGKSENIFHCGAAGAGLATKQINNYLSGVCMLGTSEAMNMGRLYGLDPKVLAGVINVSTGMNYNSREQNPVKGVTQTAAASKDFEGGFSIELAKGVIGMAAELGKDIGAKSVLADVVTNSFEEASRDERCKGKDCRSIYRWLADV